MPSIAHLRSSCAALFCLTIPILGASAANSPNDSYRGPKVAPTFNGVRLVLDSEEVSPTTTFELRFEQAMVPPQSAGLVAQTSPLVIKPPLKGNFTWLSQRSGVFVPTEPLALATDYQLRLAPNLKNAEGKLADAKLVAECNTPPMQVTDTSPSGFKEKDAPSNPKIIAQFNVRVKPEVLAPYVAFKDMKGHSIAALVTAAKIDEGYFEGPENSLKAWRDRFKKMPNESANASLSGETLSLAPNRIVIRSAQPLAPGQGWRCILKKGLPATDGPEKLPEDYEIRSARCALSPSKVSKRTTQLRRADGFESSSPKAFRRC